jgi:hypothetical protein
MLWALAQGSRDEVRAAAVAISLAPLNDATTTRPGATGIMLAGSPGFGMHAILNIASNCRTHCHSALVAGASCAQVISGPPKHKAEVLASAKRLAAPEPAS